MPWYVRVLAWLTQALFGWWTGERKEKAAAEDRAEVAQDRTIIANEETRHEVEIAVAKLPDAPPVKVADAPADSAAGKLRDEWSRD